MIVGNAGKIFAGDKIIGPFQFLYLVFLDVFSKSAPFALGGRVKKGVRTKSAPLLRKHNF